MPVIRFETKPYVVNGRTVIRVPLAASAQLPSRSRVMVKGIIQERRFAVPLEPDGNGSHWFEADTAMRKAGVKAGSTVTVAIEPTRQWPEPTVPTDLKVVLAASSRISSLWASITPMARWEWIRWIGSTKQAETRQRRIEVTCSKLRAGSRRPCCFNRSMCCVPDVAKNGVLIGPSETAR